MRSHTRPGSPGPSRMPTDGFDEAIYVLGGRRRAGDKGQPGPGRRERLRPVRPDPGPRRREVAPPRRRAWPRRTA